MDKLAEKFKENKNRFGFYVDKHYDPNYHKTTKLLRSMLFFRIPTKINDKEYNSKSNENKKEELGYDMADEFENWLWD